MYAEKEQKEKKNIFEPMKRKKLPPINSEEHFLEIAELSTYSPD